MARGIYEGMPTTTTQASENDNPYQSLISACNDDPVHFSTATLHGSQQLIGTNVLSRSKCSLPTKPTGPREPRNRRRRSSIQTSPDGNSMRYSSNCTVQSQTRHL